MINFFFFFANSVYMINLSNLGPLIRVLELRLLIFSILNPQILSFLLSLHSPHQWSSPPSSIPLLNPATSFAVSLQISNLQTTPKFNPKIAPFPTQSSPNPRGAAGATHSERSSISYPIKIRCAKSPNPCNPLKIVNNLMGMIQYRLIAQFGSLLSKKKSLL